MINYIDQQNAEMLMKEQVDMMFFLKKQLFKRDLMMTETNPVQQEINTIIIPSEPLIGDHEPHTEQNRDFTSKGEHIGVRLKQHLMYVLL